MIPSKKSDGNIMEYYIEWSFIRCFSLSRAPLLSSESIDTGLLLQVLSQLSSPPATKGAHRMSLRDAVTHQHGAPWRIEGRQRCAMRSEENGMTQLSPPYTGHTGKLLLPYPGLSRNPGVTSHTFIKASPLLGTPRGQLCTGDHTRLHVTTL